MTEQEYQEKNKAGFYDALGALVGGLLVTSLAVIASVAIVVGAIKVIGWLV